MLIYLVRIINQISLGYIYKTPILNRSIIQPNTVSLLKPNVKNIENNNNQINQINQKYCSIEYRCWPIDLDIFLHMNNAMYFRIAELSRWYIYLTMYLSIYLDGERTIYLSIYLSLYLVSLYISMHLTLYMSMYLSMHLCIGECFLVQGYLQQQVSIYLSNNCPITFYLSIIYISTSIYLISLYLIIYLSIYLSIYLILYLSIYLSS
jgi:hypothetical protein